MFGDHVVVSDRLDHLNIELFLPICEPRFEDYEKVVILIGFEIVAFCKSRHLSPRQVDPALYLSSAIAELEHIGVILPVVVL